MMSLEAVEVTPIICICILMMLYSKKANAYAVCLYAVAKAVTVAA
jgi:hypothetical protein